MQYNSQIQGNSYSLPPPIDRSRDHYPNNRIIAAKLRNNYERVDPSSYGYNLPETYSSSHKGTKQSHEYRIQPPVISTHHERSVINKPSWWG